MHVGTAVQRPGLCFSDRVHQPLKLLAASTSRCAALVTRRASHASTSHFPAGEGRSLSAAVDEPQTADMHAVLSRRGSLARGLTLFGAALAQGFSLPSSCSAGEATLLPQARLPKGTWSVHGHRSTCLCIPVLGCLRIEFPFYVCLSPLSASSLRGGCSAHRQVSNRVD